MERHRQHDPFAEIASREHPSNGEHFKEIPPLAYQKTYFAPGRQASDKPEEASYEQQLALFQEQLEQLRGRYAPFLRKLAPAASLRRTRIELAEFQFRYKAEEDSRFRRILEGAGEWETAGIPDFRGPTDEEGRWTGYYRSEFAFRPASPDNRVYLAFKGVDYKAAVYFNDKCVGAHEGFFAPFEFDVTELLQENNTLVIEVQNDYPMMGVGGTLLDGDKIYAATGPGWDDPDSGWHHCPPGAGLYNKVYVEERPPLFIKDIFVRPNIDEAYAEIWVDAENATDGLIEDREICIEILPDNFTGETYGPFPFVIAYAGPGMNYFRYRIELPAFRLWELESPCLYIARVSLRSGGQWTDCQDRHFGMRKFQLDEQSLPKGSLYFNNRPIILRGANEMGHLQQCVMRADDGQLIDDILIAKLANMNFFRMTQRPVQEEIYDYFDRLGMLHQSDLPTFGHIRRNQFVEAVRQAAEMERLIRSHPSSVIVSLINEPSRTEKRRKGHRFLFRDELEAFFVAARQAIYIENPDRVVKNTDGDYDPPTREGLPDFHCYTMWYTDNIMPVGKMHHGFLPPIREGWKAGCGEYGAEGLDNLDVMRAYYPKEWLPAGESENELWTPEKIVRAQTYGMHGDWYTEQRTIGEWIRASQRHQSLATKWMTDAWRRRADYVVSTAVHLLIDAWPSGWMKALVGVDRVPKPAYFIYRSCLEPVRVHLRCDRLKAYEGEQLEIEVWLLNDTANALENCRILATLRDEAGDYGHYELPAESVPHTASKYAGTIRFTVPQVTERRCLYVDASLLDDRGNAVNRERLAFEAFPDIAAGGLPVKAAYIGEDAKRLAASLRLSAEAVAETGADEGADWRGDIPLIVSSGKEFAVRKASLLKRVREGASLLLIRGSGSGGEQDAWEIEGADVEAVRMKTRYTLAIERGTPGLEWMREDDFSYFYDKSCGRIEGIADSQLAGEGLETIVFTYLYRRSAGEKVKLPVVASKLLGKGVIYFIALPLAGRVGCNPVLDRFLISLLGSSGRGHEASAVQSVSSQERQA